MKALQDIKDRCVIDEVTGCWNFKGAISSDGQPRVWCFDFNKGKMASLPGRRAVWYVLNQKPLPKKWRVFGTCSNPACMNPDHIKSGSAKEMGRVFSRNPNYHNIARKIASRKTGAARSVFTPETLQYALTSPETGIEVARKLGISRQAVSKARTGAIVCFTPLSSPFAGLGDR